MAVVVCIPFRDRGTDPLRRANLEYVRDYWCGFGDVVVVDDGRHGDEPFNRSAAYNRAAAATDADILVYVEADFLVPYEQVRQAISMAASGAGVVVPFTDYRSLTAEDSERVRAGVKDPAACVPGRRIMSEFGPATVMSRATLEAVGCWDEGFSGHGYDDLAMGLAFELAAGPTRFVGGPGYHLHHLPGYEGAHLSNADRAAIADNKQRFRLYQQARRKAAQEVRQFTRGDVQITGGGTGRIVLGIPLYRWVPAPFFSRFLSLDASPVLATIAIDGAYVVEAFDTIVKRALEDIPGWDRLVILEHDMIPESNALLRMASYSPEFPVVGGFYFNRGKPYNALVYIEQDGQYQPITATTAKAWIDKPGLYRCDGLGFGLVSFARHVLADWPDDVPMFDVPAGGDVGSHDLYFCRQARLLGHDIYVDSGTVCDHLGEERIGLEHNQAHAHLVTDPQLEFVR